MKITIESKRVDSCRTLLFPYTEVEIHDFPHELDDIVVIIKQDCIEVIGPFAHRFITYKSVTSFDEENNDE